MPQQKDEAFLQDLDARLHYIEEGTGLANRSGATINLKLEGYNQEEKLTEEEMARLLKLINTVAGDYALAPCNTNMGLSAGFALWWIMVAGMLHTAECALSFTERQLPETVAWETMAEAYMGERNLELLGIIGIERPVPNKSRYDY